MVTRPVVASSLTTARVVTEVDGGFAIEAHPLDAAIGCLAVFRFDVGNNRRHFGKFFCGLALTTACQR